MHTSSADPAISENKDEEEESPRLGEMIDTDNGKNG